MFKHALLAALAFAAAVPAFAEETPKAVSDALHTIFPSATEIVVARAELPGFHQAIIQGQVLFISDDGKYLIRGQVFDTVARTDIGEKLLAARRKDTLARIPASKEIVFAPKNPKYTVTVFTDVDCPYCREFHKQIAQYNDLGIAVNYVLFPLAFHVGADKKAESVWCSGDRNGAYTSAMAGKDPGKLTCANPIAELTQLGKSMGVDGTPAIFDADGNHVGGYIAPDKLVERLQQLSPKGRELTAK